MNRQAFLEQVWKPYPSGNCIPAGALCGRVVGQDSTHFRLQVKNEVLIIEAAELENQAHSQLGAAIERHQLSALDWVAWLPEKQSLYLLSPCLGEPVELGNRDPINWSGFLTKIENFFVDKGFHHIRTPYLVLSPGVDHYIDFMEVTASQTQRKWTLPTSPEIHLKKHLCVGLTQIFEIKNCFRDDLPGPNHTAEFTMLEWYRSFVGLDSVAEDLQQLIEFVLEKPVTLGRRTVAEAFEQEAGLELTPETSIEDLKSGASTLKIEWQDSDDWNDLFFRIFMEKVEPGLGRGGPELMFDFPSQQASLSQVGESGWAQRFELYWNGVELANAYLEVNNPQSNKHCFEEEANKREKRGASLPSVDEEFFRAMAMGMPPASGIALGLDRLYSILQSFEGN